MTISWDFEISLLHGNFYSGSSHMRFDLYHTFPGSNKIPFPSTLFPLRKEVSQEILKTLFSTKFSSMNHFQQPGSPSPTVLHHSTFPKMTVFGQDILIWKKRKRQSIFCILPLVALLKQFILPQQVACPSPTNSFIHSTHISWAPTSF